MTNPPPAARIEPKTIRLPVRDGRMVIPPNMLTPGDQLVIDVNGRVSVQRGVSVFVIIEPQTPMGPFEWPNSKVADKPPGG
jgi:hypothetical protein